MFPNPTDIAMHESKNSTGRSHVCLEAGASGCCSVCWKLIVSEILDSSQSSKIIYVRISTFIQIIQRYFDGIFIVVLVFINHHQVVVNRWMLLKFVQELCNDRVFRRWYKSITIRTLISDFILYLPVFI